MACRRQKPADARHAACWWLTSRSSFHTRSRSWGSSSVARAMCASPRCCCCCRCCSTWLHGCRGTRLRGLCRLGEGQRCIVCGVRAACESAARRMLHACGRHSMARSAVFLNLCSGNSTHLKTPARLATCPDLLFPRAGPACNILPALSMAETDEWLCPELCYVAISAAHCLEEAPRDQATLKRAEGVTVVFMQGQLASLQTHDLYFNTMQSAHATMNAGRAPPAWRFQRAQ